LRYQVGGFEEAGEGEVGHFFLLFVFCSSDFLGGDDVVGSVVFWDSR
jgi:hypothetical protein